MQWKNLWVQFSVFQSFFSLLWGICFMRAYNFYNYTSSLVAQEYPSVSADTDGDFRFSKAIVFCYLVSFLVGTMLVWLVSRRPNAVFGLLTATAYFIVVVVLASKPESVIVMFPDPTPFIALLLSIVMGIVAIIAMVVIKLRNY